VRFRCTACGQPPKGLEFEGKEECPKCGRSAAAHPVVVHALDDVHFMVMDAKGPIAGYWGRQHVACEPGREHLNLLPDDRYAATDHPPAVTCPACRGTRAWKEAARAHKGLARELEALQAAVKGGVELKGHKGD
jgi:hypothetical protein